MKRKLQEKILKGLSLGKLLLLRKFASSTVCVFLCCFVFFVFCVFYFFKISKFALPGVMLIYERTSKDRKKVFPCRFGRGQFFVSSFRPGLVGHNVAEILRMA